MNTSQELLSLLEDKSQKWDTMSIDDRLKLLKKLMPEKDWESLRDRMSVLAYKDLRPLQRDMIDDHL